MKRIGLEEKSYEKGAILRNRCELHTANYRHKVEMC